MIGRNERTVAGFGGVQMQGAQFNEAHGRGIVGAISAVDAACRPQTRLEAAEADADAAIGSLHATVQHLAERMNNVLQPSSPCGDACEDKQSIRVQPSAAVAAHERHASRIRFVEQIVVDLLGRLEA